MSALSDKHTPSSLRPTDVSSPHRQQPYETQARSRVHTLLSENFQLRERMERLEGEVRKGEEERRELKDRVKLLLEELASSDKLVEEVRRDSHEMEHTVGGLEEKNAEYEAEIVEYTRKVERLMGHIGSLETQIGMLSNIKEKYMIQLGRARSDLDFLSQERESLKEKNSDLMEKNNALMIEVQDLENEVETGRRQLQQYEQFVLSKVEENAVPSACGAGEGCSGCVQGSRLYLRYRKYKQKAGRYKGERDQLLQQMGRMYKQMDCSTLRQYYSSRDEKQGSEVLRQV